MPPPRRDSLVDRVLGVWHSKCNLCKKFAFTLAEVLITLGIIGVVAALTMPMLIGNYQKKQTVVRLQKAYTSISQAVKMSELENGELKYWDYNLGAKEFYDTYIKKYLNKADELKYSDYKNMVTYKNLNGTTCWESWCNDNNSYYIKLTDGAIIAFSNYLGGNYKAFTVDINGFKIPNTTGKDYFPFTIQEKGVLPYGAGYSVEGTDRFDGNYNRTKIMSSSGRGCSKTGTGVWCSALIIRDGWQILSDYPW